IRKANSSGRTFKGRRRDASSARRTAGITPVARHGGSSFTSRCHSPSCCSRSSGSWKRRTLKKDPFTKPTKFSHRPLLLRPVGPTELHPDAHLQGGAGEDRIPFRHLPVPPPLQRHRLRPVEHAHQRSHSPTVQMLCQAPHQALHGLILHHRDAHPARVLQARGEEADAARRPIPKLDVTCPKSCWLNSPGRPSKRTRGLTSFGRKEATKPY